MPVATDIRSLQMLPEDLQLFDIDLMCRPGTCDDSLGCCNTTSPSIISDVLGCPSANCCTYSVG